MESMSDVEKIDHFLRRLWSERGIAELTRIAYREDLLALSGFLLPRGQTLDELTQADLYDYLATRTANGNKVSSLNRQLSAYRTYFRQARLDRRLSSDPCAGVKIGKALRPLPKALTEKEVVALLEAADLEDPRGLRDKAMLELMYATGLRVSELVSLNGAQVNIRQGALKVTGKGGKDRLLPIGDAALGWLQQYLEKARPQLVRAPSSNVLFLSERGAEMTRQAFWYRIKQLSARAGIAKNVSPHTLRHSFATHLVNHGADLRVVQLLLGHSNLSTTEIYTLVARDALKRLHREHHPRG